MPRKAIKSVLIKPGARFGKLLIIEKGPYVTIKYGKIKGTANVSSWICQCDCGKIKTILQHYLVRGTQSCGCGIYRRTLQPDSPVRDLFRAYKSRSIRKGLPFLLSLERFQELTSSNCHYCGIKPRQKWNYRGAPEPYLYNGIDRKNNKKGYTLLNSLPCCGLCNDKKKAMTYGEFIIWIRTVYDKLLGIEVDAPRRPTA